uniref:Polysacc_synt_4 domain-containing protein n=1 Tax=Panagrellus redivivus TaxID=6233 RepID=A0A7E4VQP9_PANRE
MADLATQLNDDGDNYINDPSLEFAWVMQATEKASIHMNVIMAVDTRKLKLTKDQDEIYAKFREMFPNLDVRSVDENELKADNKATWAEFCKHFETVDDYNFGTIMRIKADGIYNSENTIICPKIIFLAVEGARNVEGINEEAKPIYVAKHKAEQDGSGQVL